MNEENNIKQCIEDFLKKNLNTEYIYNEFSLQFELGIFLRNNGFNVYFEKNVMAEFGKEYSKDFIKKEMDLYVIGKDNEKYAIELKYPTNGAYPKRMFQFLADIQFMESVKKNLSFTKTFCLALINTDRKGGSFMVIGKKNTNDELKPIYSLFRSSENSYNNSDQFFAQQPIHGKINNPINSKKSTEPPFVKIEGSYNIKWNKANENFWYYLLEI
ncbi:hypothetical protein FSU_0106 [Fibrobacter succinogenes subsp. succinogenes S85]|uniref:Uncharacterized protein n=1 Tax=Fibrobacter succinogenes (strain ATCC 19169 / S85) TaxID=59374 RepID=C9RNW4_FIBSS|nr:hypothetical protein [Fibrobacter succinogenes]ACX76432.1 hypothetical protein Fisuc_2850 [Fibrobacter succinogenes subsp. succinogenes S85]ADL25342.1 hypothetical protein FSU_0106 [Fibrobacter succinogenes subsp. succinogenes S85]